MTDELVALEADVVELLRVLGNGDEQARRRGEGVDVALFAGRAVIAREGWASLRPLIVVSAVPGRPRVASVRARGNPAPLLVAPLWGAFVLAIAHSPQSPGGRPMPAALVWIAAHPILLLALAVGLAMVFILRRLARQGPGDAAWARGYLARVIARNPPEPASAYRK